MTEQPYSHPVSQLLEYGNIEFRQHPDYLALGLTDEHIPELIENASETDKTHITEFARLDREITKLQGSIDRLNGQLPNEKYVNNASAELVAKSREQLADQEGKIKELSEQRERIAGL